MSQHSLWRNDLTIFAALPFVVFAGTAIAQQPEHTKPLTVTAPIEASTLTVPNVEDAKREINRTPGGVAIVPAEQYRAGRATNIKDVLDYVPGVFSQSKYGQEDSKLSIRGSGLSRNFHLRGLKLLQDGTPINLADGGGDFQELDPLAFRYTEVFRGANALQYGAATLGGAVNFVSPTGHTAPLALVRAEGGSFDSTRYQLASGNAIGDWDYYISPTLSLSDGYREHTEQEYRRINGNVGYRIADNVETRFFASYNNIDQRVPGSLNRQQIFRTPRITPSANTTLDTKRDINSYRLSNRTTAIYGPAEITLGGYYFHRDLFHPLTFGVVDDDIEDYGGTARAKIDLNIFNVKNETVLGINAGAGQNHAQVYRNVRGIRGPQTSDNLQKSTNLDIYGENQFYVHPRLAVVTGLQVNQAERKLDDYFLRDGNDSGKRSYTSFNPKGGLRFDVTKDAQIFTNVSRSSEPPTFSELNPSIAPGFADLKPQRATTVEVGTRGSLDRINWDLALYRAWVENELQLFVTPGSGGGGYALNADRTIHQGVEFGFGADVLREIFIKASRPDTLQVNLAYTFSDFRFDDDRQFGDNDLPGAPPHYVRAELRYKHPLGFYLGPNVEWVPEGYYVDNANTDAQATRAYALLGAKAGIEFDFGLTLFFDARNLTDKTYISNTNTIPLARAIDALYNPGNGRAFFGGMEFRW